MLLNAAEDAEHVKEHPHVVAAGQHVFELIDVHVVFGTESVLQNVTLRIAPGEFVGILGPNGSGKTTLLRTLLGLQKVTHGHVHAFGEVRCTECTKGRIGFVSQHASTPPRAASPFTVRDVVLTGRIIRRGLGRRFVAEDHAACIDALRRVGLEAKMDARLSELSGGQRQRAFLARALASEPEVLVLDEPTTGLDTEARRDFFSLLDQLNHRDGLTIVLVSHDTDAVLSSAHRVIVLNRRILYDGPAGPLRNQLGPLTFTVPHGAP